jgi:hypothetical protein
MTVHSIYYPKLDAASPPPVKHGKQSADRAARKYVEPRLGLIDPQPRVAVLDLLIGALQDAHLISRTLDGLLKVGGDRHGDLQVALSALRRLEGHVVALIAAEENS